MEGVTGQAGGSSDREGKVELIGELMLLRTQTLGDVLLLLAVMVQS